jgi:hypothetical protein
MRRDDLQLDDAGGRDPDRSDDREGEHLLAGEDESAL